MPSHIIDCCSLINLFTGWGGLAELPGLGQQWHLCEAVLKEAEYTREYRSDGQPIPVPLDFSKLIESRVIHVVTPTSDEELDDYLAFASEVDDGEAQALAIARHRGFTLLTDDHAAMRLAARPEILVPTISTARVLQMWADSYPQNVRKLPGVIARIEELARFSPRRSSPDYAWWHAQRSAIHK